MTLIPLHLFSIYLLRLVYLLAHSLLQILFVLGSRIVYQPWFVKLLIQVCLALHTLSLINISLTIFSLILYRNRRLWLQVFNVSVFKFWWSPLHSLFLKLAPSIAKWTEILLCIMIVAAKFWHLRLIKIIRSLIHPLNRTFLNTTQLSVFLQRIFQPAHERFMSFLPVVVKAWTRKRTLPVMIGSSWLIIIVAITVIVNWSELLWWVMRVETWICWWDFDELSEYFTDVGNWPVIFHSFLLSKLYTPSFINQNSFMLVLPFWFRFMSF